MYNRCVGWWQVGDELPFGQVVPGGLHFLWVQKAAERSPLLPGRVLCLGTCVFSQRGGGDLGSSVCKTGPNLKVPVRLLCGLTLGY